MKNYYSRYAAPAFCLLALWATLGAAPRSEQWRPGLALYTIESEHFQIHYMAGLEHVAREAGGHLEELHAIFRDTYNLRLPSKTDVLITSDEDNFNNFAFTNTNLISLAANDFEFNLRGSGNYFRDVIAHEYAHIVSIWSSFKIPHWIPYLQVGSFSHPNEARRTEALHLFPSEILPPWFYEGIAQYESMRNGGDRWDSHRDMILRTLTLTTTLLSWDQMQVFAGKGDDFEKTYNHGFSLVIYIAETYGYGAIVSLLRESARLHRINFDRSIQQVLGVSGRQLHRDWTGWLNQRYRRQLESVGTQVYGRRINQDGFDNSFPRFSPGGDTVFFVSNGKNDYSFRYRALYAAALADTIDDDERISKIPVAIKGPYDIDPQNRRFVFASAKSPSSRTPYAKGGERKRDLFLDTIPDGKRRPFSPKTERQITQQRSLFMASFSPDGSRLAAAHHHYDRFFLALLDTSGNDFELVYPPRGSHESAFQTIYSIDWSPDGRLIALSYVERTGDRKIGVFDVEQRAFRLVCPTPHDDRDPRFSRDGAWLYFVSDRSGIFNVYRYRFADSTLQRITNVTGGAFAPDVSPDGEKVVYVNYDADGYGIYLLDSISVLDSSMVAHPLVARTPHERPSFDVSFSQPAPYSRLPRQFMLLPTFINEEVVSTDNDVYTGKRTFKAGAVVNLLDPFSWALPGNTLGGYFLVEPGKLGELFDRSSIVSPRVSYDLGAFYVNDVLPLDITLEYNHRSIAGSDFVYDFSGERLHIDYSLIPRRFDLQLSKSLTDVSNIPVRLHSIASYNWFDVTIEADRYPNTFGYTAEKGSRLGLFSTMTRRKADQWSAITPRGVYTKLKWDRYFQPLQNAEEMFESVQISVNYGNYVFDQFSGDIRLGQELPWKNRHTLYLQLDATAQRLTEASRERLREKGSPDRIPSFYEPGIWMPGYAYYYRRNLQKTNGNDSIADTLLISGTAVAHAGISYRFPLWPRLIDRKLGFLYFERLLGAVNAHTGTGWNAFSQVRQTRPQDLLTTIGAELRLEASTFGVYPLALSLRWDRGLDKPRPIGGDRFTFSLGFSFDYWEYIDIPDYRTRQLSRTRRGF